MLGCRLGLVTATALVVGEVIGVGIFLTPAEMARSLGSPFWLLAVWLAMAVATIGGALCYGALAARYPEAGGTYVYLREIFGKRTAFLYGWLSLLVTDPGLTAMLAVGLARYVGHLVHLDPWGLRAVAVGVDRHAGDSEFARCLTRLTGSGYSCCLEDRLAGDSRGLGLRAGPRRLGQPDALLVAATGIGFILSGAGDCLDRGIHLVCRVVGCE